MGEPEGSHGASVSKLQIEAVLTVPPLNVTEPRRVRRVVAASESVKAVGGCYQIVMYFAKSTKEEDSGRFWAGWAVESLGRVLSDYPFVAGRIRRREGGDGDGGLEVVSNDCGVRMLEARMSLRMSEFLGLKEKDVGEVVFWKDVDEHTPQFSPLFYVQVTRFECGGYSIGISCSLVLADFLILHNFLKKWAEIHSKILSQNEDTNPKTKTPIFYHPRLKNPDPPPTEITTPTPTEHQVQTVIFKVTSEDTDFSHEVWRDLAMTCVEEAEQKLERNMGEKFTMLVRESCEVIRVETCSKSTKKSGGIKHEIACTTWDDSGEYQVGFQEGDKAIVVSRWIGSVCDCEGHVMVVPHRKQEGVGVCAAIVVSLPVGKTTTL